MSALLLALAVGCAVDDGRDHALGSSAPGRPGTLGQTLGGPPDASAASADVGPLYDPSEPGAPQAVVLEAPYAGGHEFMVAKDEPATSGAHGPYYVAFDVGTTQEVVRAALPGTVIAVNDIYSEGGPAPELLGATNTVVVEHEGGVRTEYLHLRTLSAKVVSGQKVIAGHALAVAGGTGYVGGQRIGLRATRGGMPAPICFNTGHPTCDFAQPGDVIESANYYMP